MSKKSRKSASASRTSKQERFSNNRTSHRLLPVVVIGGIVVLFAVVLGTAYARGRASPVAVAGESAALRAATSGHDPYPRVAADNGVVRLPASTFDDGQAHYYTYMHEDRPVEFFVLESNDGVVRAAFNACDVCFNSKKGYTQDGDEMVCNNCGQRFPADKINVVKGGCNPSPLERTLDGDTLVIRVSDIISGLKYFS